MNKSASISGKPLRADALRNRERLLEAAKQVVGAGGAQASLEAVAAAAGVGIGTLYRHFPTREALFEALYRREVDQLTELAALLATEAEPVDALRRWLRANIEFVATKRGMAAALALATYGANLTAYTAERLTRAVAGLMGRAVAAGVMRDDVRPEDVLRALVSLCHGADEPDWQGQALRLINVFVDGLERCVDTPASGGRTGDADF